MAENEGTTDSAGTDGDQESGSATDQNSGDVGDAGKRAIDAMKAERNAAKAEAAAVRKELQNHQAELQKLKDRDLSELERAQKVAADADARLKEITAKAADRVARATFNAMAAQRNPDVKTADVLEYVDLSRFVDENGDVDEKGLQAAVSRLIPAPGGNPALEGGARRTPPTGQDMNQIIREAAGRA